LFSTALIPVHLAGQGRCSSLGRTHPGFFVLLFWVVFGEAAGLSSLLCWFPLNLHRNEKGPPRGKTPTFLLPLASEETFLVFTLAPWVCGWRCFFSALVSLKDLKTADLAVVS